MNEFELIRRFFTRKTTVPVGIGDDCAIVDIPAGKQLCITTDTLTEGIHFTLKAEAKDIGYKTLAVNISDLASCGAEPLYATLALTLPAIDESWLADFSDGFFECADIFGVQLIGGDTTEGPLSMTVCAHGIVDTGKALLRSGARAGDLIFVTDTLGDAALALQGHLSDAHSLARLHRPFPQVEMGLALVNIASSCIDVSDGLLQDLGHILQQSHKGAVIQHIPLSEAARTIDSALAIECALTGGDDYVLCFTVAPEKIHALPRGVLHIGYITDTLGCYVVNEHGVAMLRETKGFMHFTQLQIT